MCILYAKSRAVLSVNRSSSFWSAAGSQIDQSCAMSMSEMENRDEDRRRAESVR